MPDKLKAEPLACRLQYNSAFFQIPSNDSKWEPVSYVYSCLDLSAAGAPTLSAVVQCQMPRKKKKFTCPLLPIKAKHWHEVN